MVGGVISLIQYRVIWHFFTKRIAHNEVVTPFPLTKRVMRVCVRVCTWDEAVTWSKIKFFHQIFPQRVKRWGSFQFWIEIPPNNHIVLMMFRDDGINHSNGINCFAHTLFPFWRVEKGHISCNENDFFIVRDKFDAHNAFVTKVWERFHWLVKNWWPCNTHTAKRTTFIDLRWDCVLHSWASNKLSPKGTNGWDLTFCEPMFLAHPYSRESLKAWFMVFFWLFEIV